MRDTEKEVEEVLGRCRALFADKLKDYGPSWRILRPESVTDQIYIKAERIRNIQALGTSRVEEGIESEFIGIVNYGLVGMMQLEHPSVTTLDISNDTALEWYDRASKETRDLLRDKNHDYGEVWRNMRISSFVDIILTKLFRTKQIEDNSGKTLVSEGVKANYMDMVNYAIFALIKLDE